MTTRKERDSQRKFCPADWLCDVTQYKMLVSKGFRIMDHMTTEERTEMVHKAVQNKDLDLLKAMMDNGLQPVERFASYDIWWLLYEAVKVSKNEEDNIKILTFLMDNGCNPELEEGVTETQDIHPSPLCLAVEKDLWNIADLLISRGANLKEDLDAQEAIGESFSPKLFGMLEKNNLRFHLDASSAFIRGLLQGGPMLADKVSPGEVSIRSAEHYRKNQIPMLKSLVAKGIKFPLEDGCDQRMCLIYDVIVFCCERSDDHLHEVVRILIDYGVDIESNEYYSGETAVYKAARLHKEKVVRLLIEKGANVNIDGLGKSPLLCLAERECGLLNFELFKFMMESGCDVTHKKPHQKFVPKIFGICMNENMKYEKHIIYMLDTCEILVHPVLNNLNLEVFQPSILYKLVQVGLRGHSLLKAVLRHALKTQNRRGYELVRQVSPNVQNILEHDDFSEFYLESNATTLIKRISDESRDPCSLIHLAIRAIRNNLIASSNFISILPRIRELAAEIPVDLRPMLTLDYYMTDDNERCLLTAQDNEHNMYTRNRKVMKFNKEDIPWKGHCKC